MTDLEIIECSQAIYDYLIDDNNDKKMNDTLSKYNTHMVAFTNYLNIIYEIYPEPLWRLSEREFFSTTKGIEFYKILLRDLKIRQCLS